MSDSRRPARLRVLHIGKFYPPVAGGMERILQQICEGAGHRVETRVLVAGTTRRTVVEKRHGVVVTRVGCVATVGSVAVCPTFPIWLRRQAADVTVLHEPNPMALAAALLSPLPGRLVTWFHSEVVRPAWRYRLFYRPLLRRILTRSDRIVVSSPALAAQARELNDFRSKCVVIPFGVDADRFAASPAVRSRAAALAHRRDGVRLLFVGRLVGYKGVDILLRAVRSVPVSLVIVGDGPQRPALERLALTLGLRRKVHFVGHVTDVELLAHYHACDALVLPSVTRAEAFGVVQLEAMACGKPVVSTSLPTGVPWVNRHRSTGLVVPPGDVDRLREAVELLVSDGHLRRALGAQGYQRVRHELTIRDMVARIVALYEEVSGRAIGFTRSGPSLTHSRTVGPRATVASRLGA